jgi:hypothetical protein
VNFTQGIWRTRAQYSKNAQFLRIGLRTMVRLRAFLGRTQRKLGGTAHDLRSKNGRIA